MFALSYDSALRREELCALEIRDLDVANRMLTVRAETTKSHRTRVVPFGPHSNSLYTAYLHHRRELSNKPGPLFLSESNRNRTAPVTIWTWSKVVESIAARAGVPRFSTHTNRHLCLTDLARSGWDIYRIATFARAQRHPNDDEVHPFERSRARRSGSKRYGADSRLAHTALGTGNGRPAAPGAT